MISMRTIPPLDWLVSRLPVGMCAEEVIDKAVEEYTTEGYTPEQTRQEVSTKLKRVLKKYENG